MSRRVIKTIEENVLSQSLVFKGDFIDLTRF